MESVAARSTPRARRLRPRFEGPALSAWALVGAIVLYLSIDGGGYDLVVSSQVGLAVWWIVLIGAALGLLPAARLSRTAWTGLSLLAAFVLWTALATTWSESSERSLQELARVACYLGILVLAVAVHRDRERALRHTTGALAAAIAIVAGLAVLSRLRPELIPAAHQTSSFLPGTQARLAWPLNYWNALAALLAIGLPLLLALVSSARTLIGQAAAAAGLPLLALAGYLTFSRGGAIAAAVAVAAFLVLAPERLPKLATASAAAAGSAILILGAVHRGAIEHGLTNATADRQGRSLLVALICVCAGVALAQVGIGLAERHGTIPSALRVAPRRARMLSAAVLVAAAVAAIAAGVPGRLPHAWRDFKHPTAPALTRYSLSRFGTLSGNGRYDYWNVAVSASGDHLVGGSGPGTFQLIWLPRAPYASYVENAHSLYVETLSDDGLVGLAVLVGFLTTVVATAFVLVARSRHEARTVAAGVAAALVAFCVSAAYDWIWQVPAVPAAFLVLAGAVLAPALPARRRPGAVGEGPRAASAGRLLARAAIVVSAVACLSAIAVPLATTTAVRKSQQASSVGNAGLALRDAAAAARLEPGAASPQLQTALVLEAQGSPGAALGPARQAARDEPENWTIWLTLSRLETETRHAQAALADYRRARALNPQSSLFRQ